DQAEDQRDQEECADCAEGRPGRGMDAWNDDRRQPYRGRRTDESQHVAQHGGDRVIDAGTAHHPMCPRLTREHPGGSMASRAQQMQSHQFTLQRVTAALAMRDPDAAASPVRRSAGIAFAGVMIAVVALAAVAAYGVLRPGDNTTWRDGRSVIIERETGARF